jgi:ubiquinone/menaquinone biosynthesis C-methylase UbiE
MQPETSQLRSDYKKLQAFFGDTRTEECLIEHYRLEHTLAKQILNAPACDRPRIYTEAYDKLFESLQFQNEAFRQRHIRSVWRRLHSRVKNKVFLEIGCGDAAVAAALAPYTNHCYALDVTDAPIDRKSLPSNFTVLLATGTSIPLPDSSVDFVFSDQVFEHLHPQDARAHLDQVRRVLRPSGLYLCVTPNRVTGPHDISCFFDYEATGLHLHECDSTELSRLLKESGFWKLRFYISAYGFEVGIPSWSLRLLERGLLALPRQIRTLLITNHLVRVLAGLDVLATRR